MTDRRIANGARIPGALRGVGLPHIPTHVAVMLSAVTATYAVTLAGVAGLQAADEAARVAERAPALDGVERLAAGHDRLADRLEASRRDYAGAAAAYTDASAMLAEVDRQLAELAALVEEIDGVARALPTTVHVPVRTTVTQVKAPKTHATTGASGG